MDPTRHHRLAMPRARRCGYQQGHRMNAATTPTAEEELQTLLDAPLFDPWSETPDECSIDTPSGCLPGLERFKQMVREDYYMAEALWAGVFCSVMVTVAMQMVKAYIVATLPAPPPLPDV